MVIEGATISGFVSASTAIENIAFAHSSSIFVYDLAEQVGFGAHTLVRNQDDGKGSLPKVVNLQTRAGAGLSLAGRLSEEGTSKDTQKDSVIAAYTTLTGLQAMVSSFAFLPPPLPNKRLVLHVPVVSHVGPSLEFSPTLAALPSILSLLPSSFAVILSSTPGESIHLANAAYSIADRHVIHLFDHFSAGREINNLQSDIVETTALSNVYDTLKDVGYGPFDYAGDANATTVLLVLNGYLGSAAKAFAKRTSGLGIITVRILRPWDDASFLAALPRRTRVIQVLDEVSADGTQGSLYSDVFSACIGSDRTRPAVRALRLTPARIHDFVKQPSSFASFLDGTISTGRTAPLKEENTKKIVLLESSSSPLLELTRCITSTFLENRAILTRSITDYDAFSKLNGVSATRILLSPVSTAADEFIPIHLQSPLTSGNPNADFLAVLDQSLLKTHKVVDYVRENSGILLFTTSWSAPEVVSNLRNSVREQILKKNIKLYLVNLDASESGLVQNIIGHLAFLRLYLGANANETSLRNIARTIYRDADKDLNIDKVNAKAWAALEGVHVPLVEDLEEATSDLISFEFNSFNAGTSAENEHGSTARLGSWHDAAKHILFPDAFVPALSSTAAQQGQQEPYPQNPALRPEIADRTYLVTCSVNRRLTPLDYDRNVFHLEFDTRGTGLRYAIGEALGVHGWNDADEVLEFCRWYGVDFDRLITIPIPGSNGKTMATDRVVHTRTVFQALHQQIDLFGKPPKSFYADLAAYATSKSDKLSLQFISSPEGSATFKKLSEKDMVTFADVLRRFSSARPGIEALCEMIGDIKPRHYSIASAQSVVRDRVDLLVVTVEWKTPSGKQRYGQCTRYLAGLKVGQKVTVSIKPSVMKLPPSDMQPLILAGLGTGAAPFRAFLQHRAQLVSQGKPAGPLYYYFGSRYRSKEYLYGEEIEAFILDGTITRAGLAFSRDTRKKVYIQHKMVEDAVDLARMLRDENGVFYLCGPTWPVPDVFQALVTALVSKYGLDEKQAGDYLEGLKEEERYVLEVY